MLVTLAATGRFHFVDLANQMARLGVLSRLYTGYPRWKLPELNLPSGSLHTYPWFHSPFMAVQRLSSTVSHATETFDWIDRLTFDSHVANHLQPCDIYTAISGCGLRSGARAKTLGARYVCDRGSTHIKYQNRILQDEYSNWDLPFTPTHPRIVEREISEYEQADLITVPSRYAKQTFIDEGIPASKLRVIPYGVDLTSFSPVDQPAQGSFNVAYVGGINLRKGIPYLCKAFSKLKHPRKALWLIGQQDHRVVERMKTLGLCPSDVQLLGHIEQSQLKYHLSRASVLVLPSIEDGFGLVAAQAMACGCPVIATTHSGAAEMVEDGVNGYVVPARSVYELTDAIQRLAEEPDMHQMRKAARECVLKLDGWRQYGDQVLQTYQSLCGAS